MYTTLSVLADLAAAAPQPMAAPKTISEVISGITGWVMGIIAVVATMFLVIGGLRYMAAGGDPAQVDRPPARHPDSGPGTRTPLPAERHDQSALRRDQRRRERKSCLMVRHDRRRTPACSGRQIRMSAGVGFGCGPASISR